MLLYFDIPILGADPEILETEVQNSFGRGWGKISVLKRRFLVYVLIK